MISNEQEQVEEPTKPMQQNQDRQISKKKTIKK